MARRRLVNVFDEIWIARAAQLDAAILARTLERDAFAEFSDARHCIIRFGYSPFAGTLLALVCITTVGPSKVADVYFVECGVET